MKILIVDDEALVRAGMRSIVDWEKYGYTIIGEASNGLQAIELAKAYLPDIILVDIVMPLMSGLDFISEIKQELQSCKFIILSCMDQIDYYKKAISIGVSEYLLKSCVNSEDILAVLNRVSEDIRKERVFDNIEDTNKALFNKHIVLNEFINMVLKKKISQGTDIENKLTSYGIKLNFTSSYIFTVRLDAMESGHALDVSFSQGSVINLCQQMINSMGTGYIFLNYEDVITAIVSYSGSLPGEEYIKDIGNMMQETIQQCLDINITLGVSRPLKGYDEIHIAYEEAMFSLSRVFFSGNGHIYFYRNCEFDDLKAQQLRSQKEKIIQTMSLSDIGNIIECLSEIYKLLLAETSFSVKYVKKVYIDIFYHLLEIFTIEKISLDELIEDKYEPLNFVQDASSLHDLNEGICTLIANAKTKYMDKFKLSQSNTINQIKSFIVKKLDSKISLDEIANEVHLSADYICRLFKKETGDNLSSYIIEQRISKAKKMLLSGASTAQIIEASGFSSESYFIKTFKTCTGITPGQYVKQTLS